MRPSSFSSLRVALACFLLAGLAVAETPKLDAILDICLRKGIKPPDCRF